MNRWIPAEWKSNNVCSVKRDTKCSSVLLLCLVFFFMERTLSTYLANSNWEPSWGLQVFQKVQMSYTKDRSNKAWHLWIWVVLCLQFHERFLRWPWFCKQLLQLCFSVEIFQSGKLCSVHSCSFSSSLCFHWHGRRCGSICVCSQKQLECGFPLPYFPLWSHETSFSMSHAFSCWQPHQIQLWIHRSNQRWTRRGHHMSRQHCHFWRRSVDLKWQN